MNETSRPADRDPRNGLPHGTTGHPGDARRLAAELPDWPAVWAVALDRPEIDLDAVTARSGVAAVTVAGVVTWLVTTGAGLDLPDQPAVILPDPPPPITGPTPATTFAAAGQRFGLTQTTMCAVLSAIVTQAGGQPAVLHDPADRTRVAVVYPRPDHPH